VENVVFAKTYNILTDVQLEKFVIFGLLRRADW